MIIKVVKYGGNKELRKYITIFSICILILSMINVVPSKSIYDRDIETDPIDIIDNSIFNQLEEARILQNLNKLDGFFTENWGQIGNDSVRYYIQGKGVWFLDDGVVFEISEPTKSYSFKERFKDPYSLVGLSDELNKPIERKSVVLKLNFEGANQVIPEGRELLPYRSNFFYGNDSTKWCSNVPNYNEIVYRNIYDNIDLRYYTTSKGLKYDFIVHPGGEPSDIRLRYEGPEKLFIDDYGDLRIKTTLGDVEDSNLFIYQNKKNDKKEIEGKINLLTHLTYGFRLLGEYDRGKDLIIDPLIYSTFVGGNLYEAGGSLAIDPKGYAYITGETRSNDFPNTTGVYNTFFSGYNDVVVFKLNPTGSSLVYSTFIGGDDLDSGLSIAIDSSGNAYVGGITESQNFPKTTGAYDTTHNGFTDIFILKLNATGASLFYSTFVGGINTEVTYSIALDSSGYVYAAGYTHSNDFPYTPGAYDTTYNGDWDAFVFKLNSSGSSLIYSTFVGGTNRDIGKGIVIDPIGNTYVTGSTRSIDFPNTTGAHDNTHNGEDDVFVIKLNLTGSSLMYSSFFGGSDLDRGWDIAIDTSGNIYVTGTTLSADFPNTTGAYDNTYNGDSGNEWLRGDVFVFKLNSTNLSLNYSTYVGGGDYERGRCITIDSNNNAYVTGETKSPDFPNTTGALDTTHNGEEDAFVFKLNPIGTSLIYSTFIGGSKCDWSWDIIIDPNDNMFVTGWTNSIDFPITTGAYDNTSNGDRDIFVLKFSITTNNSIPAVIDLKISKPTILRTNTVYLYSNATDIEDLEKNLTPVFIEYRDPNELIWNSTYFSTPQYNNSRWEMSFTPHKNAVLSLYDFRVMFNDTDKLFSPWFYLNDSVMVLNNIPNVLDLSLSKNTSIRNETISVWINGTDIEDDERNLTIELEYRVPNEQFWNTTYLDHTKFFNERWEYNFHIPFDAHFGYYDFRARLNDSEGNYSQWLYENDSLLVFSTRPKVIDLELSNYSVYRTNSVFLYVNGTDYETPESMLTFYGQYKPHNDNTWTELTGEYNNSNNRWQCEFITIENSTLGVYDFSAKFTDNESASSNWVYLNDSLQVLNNPPVISGDLDNIKVNITPIIIDLSQYESDIEDSDEALTWSVNETKKYDYLESVSIIDSINDTLQIVPIVNVTGEVDIELTLTDKDGGTATKSDITINVDSRITELTPKVTLLLPPDKAVVNILTPKLDWKLDYYGDEKITYSVYLDETPEPETIIKSGISITSYILEDELEDGKTYYWKIVPSGGICLSEPFSFTINLSFKPIYNVNLTTEKNYIIINQGASIEVNITVKNEGNGQDNFKIEYNSSKLQSRVNIDKSNIQLAPGIKSTLKLNISIPDNFKPGEYSILVTAASLSDETISDKVTIMVKVVGKDFIPIYGVAISVLPDSIEIVQYKSENVTLVVTNIGNVKDAYKITFESDDFTIADINLSTTFLSLKEGIETQVIVMITVPDDMKPGEYRIEFIVKSDMASNNTSLTIYVKEVGGEIKPDDGKSKEDNIMISVGIWIFLIIIIALIFIMVVMKRNKIPNHESSSTETITDISSIQPSVETAAQPPAMAALTPTVTKTDQISQAPTIKQIPTVAQPPQLPPAHAPTPTPGPNKSAHVSPKIPPKQPDLPADGTTLAASDSPSQTEPKDDATPSPTVAKPSDQSKNKDNI